ncbi:antibiotic biosynthesis monooxygenase family protein [Dyella telluris]
MDLVMDNVGTAFCAIYRWRLHPGSEDSFVQAWSRITKLLLDERGSLGSRLHRGPDDIWYSYTQWPSAAAKAEGLSRPSVDPEAWGQMRAAIAESLPELILEPVADFLAPIPQDGYPGTLTN